AWITALATLILAGLTFVYVVLTRKILAGQSEPCVVLTVVHDQQRSTILQLVAKNVGAGLARDVRFEFSHPVPARAFGMSPENVEKPGLMEDGPLIDGIPALGPGESREIDWGQYHGLIAAIGEQEITAICRFKKGSKEMPPVECPLDVKSFLHTSSASTTAENSARALDKIANDINQFASGYRKLHVGIVSIPKVEADDDG
ncbi:MAG TPA: hypothetical protein DDW95_09810, partial [Alphaproteobacteria bacterium]|nr:hypothetical protein [Alphaproteobacteria bacterium]